ncbi:MAG: MOSC domain-containing protein [Candidatus Limnocylindrales bacterium]|nr:MOSC domain-containing protein [Candidatus Limnocylindrales bacterium]
MPRVARFSIAPVRSLGLEHPTEIELTELGVLEDRRFYLIDDAGRLVDRLVVPHLVQVLAHTNPAATTLRLTFPDGQIVEDEICLAEATKTAIHGRTGVGHVVDGPWAHPLSHFAGRPLRIVRTDRPGGTRSAHPATLLTDGSLARLGAELGVGWVDPRRFRMLIDLEGGEAHEEDRWVGGRVALGGTILRISAPVPRCAITTQDPKTGQRDLDTLRAIKEYRGLANGKDLLFGVWGEVERSGTIRVGEELRLLG